LDRDERTAIAIIDAIVFLIRFKARS